MSLRFEAVSLCLCLLTLLVCSSAFAQSVDGEVNAANNANDRLEILQSLIEANVLARDELRASIKEADSTELSELQQSLEALNADAAKLNKSFEQIAIGSVDVSSLDEVDTPFDWRTEVADTLEPVIENFKSLTEKPRKIGKLQKYIEQNEIQSQSIESGLVSIQEKKAVASTPAIEATLELIEKSWLRRKSDNEQERQLAVLQLSDLQNSNVSWWDTVKTSLSDFIQGRGLTLSIAILVAAIVWLLMRGVLMLSQLKTKSEQAKVYRTRKRVAQYTYNIATFLLILIAVIAVFYVRGDMLLLVLSILATASVALGLRQAIPRFINEAKILLNLGKVRESERVIYNGLPWQVTTLNLSSILSNPELKGKIRLPLSELAAMVSRPTGNETWFPAGAGDFIVLDDDRLMQVVRLTPESVALRDRGGSITAVPTTEFYHWTFKNISRGDTFGISEVFGIDYRHQDICLTLVPDRLMSAIGEAIANTDHADNVTDIKVELASAGSSSLDFLIYVTMDRKSAKGYSKLHRLVQQTCVSVCSKENWGIPFPHLTVQRHSFS